MKKDICRQFRSDIETVYNAYLKSINQKFSTDCNQTPYSFISFKLKFSVYYNMNGGTCSLYFIPYEDGTAVNIRYTVYQAALGRIEAHERDLSDFAESILNEQSKNINLSFDHFSGAVSKSSTYTPIRIGFSDILVAYLLWLFFSGLYYYINIVFFSRNRGLGALGVAIILAWITALVIVIAWIVYKSKNK